MPRLHGHWIDANSNLPKGNLPNGAAELVKKGTGDDTKFAWHPLNLTFAQWGGRAGGFVTHQGTLLRTERGVFGCGMIGTFLAGHKMPDGSIDRSSADIENAMKAETEVILEYADPDYGKHGCHRDATTGAIVCKCPDEW